MQELEHCSEHMKRKLRRIFVHDSFRDPKQWKKIVGPMPQLEDFERQRKEIRRCKSRQNNEYQVCYEEPLLNREQEQHLFRKFNFYKFRAKECLLAKKVKRAESYLLQADEVHNLLCICNVRLAVNQLKRIRMQHLRFLDDIASDAYHLVYKAVDYFDWTRGLKFSTYASWVLIKSLKKDVRVYYKGSNLRESFEDADVYSIVEPEKTSLSESEYHEIQSQLDKMIDGLKEREQFVLRELLKNRTLQSIGDDLGLSRERIRQIKEAAFQKIKDRHQIPELIAI